MGTPTKRLFLQRGRILSLVCTRLNVELKVEVGVLYCGSVSEIVPCKAQELFQDAMITIICAVINKICAAIKCDVHHLLFYTYTVAHYCTCILLHDQNQPRTSGFRHRGLKTRGTRLNSTYSWGYGAPRAFLKQRYIYMNVTNALLCREKISLK